MNWQLYFLDKNWPISRSKFTKKDYFGWPSRVCSLQFIAQQSKHGDLADIVFFLKQKITFVSALLSMEFFFFGLARW
jgi:hypothetical protein